MAKRFFFNYACPAVRMLNGKPIGRCAFLIKFNGKMRPCPYHPAGSFSPAPPPDRVFLSVELTRDEADNLADHGLEVRPRTSQAAAAQGAQRRANAAKLGRNATAARDNKSKQAHAVDDGVPVFGKIGLTDAHAIDVPDQLVINGYMLVDAFIQAFAGSNRRVLKMSFVPRGSAPQFRGRRELFAAYRVILSSRAFAQIHVWANPRKDETGALSANGIVTHTVNVTERRAVEDGDDVVQDGSYVDAATGEVVGAIGDSLFIPNGGYRRPAQRLIFAGGRWDVVEDGTLRLLDDQPRAQPRHRSERPLATIADVLAAAQA